MGKAHRLSTYRTIMIMLGSIFLSSDPCPPHGYMIPFVKLRPVGIPSPLRFALSFPAPALPPAPSMA